MREPEELLGSLVAGRYRLDKVLGEGGFGAVYVATNVHDATQVALKVLHTEALDRVGGDDRFRREAELARRLNHPNVVKVLDEGIDEDGTRYIAFELLRGRSLADELGRWGAMQPHRAVHIAIAVLDALASAHEIGIIHRDLKPANVFLLDGTNELKVLDFGIAKSINKDTIAGLTQAGQVLGTPAYMAVEQLTGDPVTPATDLFALGVLLSEMLMGKPPYPEGSGPMDIVRSRLTGSTIDLPVDLMRSPVGNIVSRATAPHPSDRYQTAAQMMGDLQQALRSPLLMNTADVSSGLSDVVAMAPTGTSLPTGIGLPAGAGPMPAPVVTPAGYTEPGAPPAMARPKQQSSTGSVLLVAGVISAIAVAGLGVGLWVMGGSTDATVSAEQDDDGDDDDDDDDDDDRPKKRKKRKKKRRDDNEPDEQAIAPPNPPPAPLPSVVPPPLPPPTLHATRVLPCRGAALQNQVTLRSHVTAIGWSVSGVLRYCAGNMVNFRCTGGDGRGVTAEKGTDKGSAAAVRFRSPAAAKTHADGERGQKRGKPMTWATDGSVLLYIDMPDAEADKLMARICK